MDSQTPDVTFAYECSPYSDDICAEFRSAVSVGGLHLRFEAMRSTRAWAGVEWVLPTAFMVWIAKSYFDGFLGEMGKDHYVALKAGIRAVADRLAGFNVTKVGTPGKVAPVQPYSLIFSVWFNRDDGTKFKFLIPIDLTEGETEAAWDSFFTFLRGWNAGAMASFDRVPYEITRPMGRVVLVAYSPETKRIEVVDPLAGRLSPE